MIYYMNTAGRCWIGMSDGTQATSKFLNKSGKFSFDIMQIYFNTRREALSVLKSHFKVKRTRNIPEHLKLGRTTPFECFEDVA